jgi:dihydrofolate reductase
VRLNFTVSLDGYGAGPEQGLKNPFGTNGAENLLNWAYTTRVMKEAHGKTGGEIGGVDGEFAKRYFENIGAWILGRNNFSPIRGPWPDEKWKGWWGDVPPFHTDVFVLTHYRRPSFDMEGGTRFHFVTDGYESALKKARQAAKEKDVEIGGGVSTAREYLKMGHVDELNLTIAPLLIGAGEHLLRDIDLLTLGYRIDECAPSPKASHIALRR